MYHSDVRFVAANCEACLRDHLHTILSLESVLYLTHRNVLQATTLYVLHFDYLCHLLMSLLANIVTCELELLMLIYVVPSSVRSLLYLLD